MKYMIRSLFLLLFLLLTCCFMAPARHAHSQQALSLHAITAKIIKVIDGDTLLVKVSDDTERIRLIGIDSPESFDNPKAERDSRNNGEKISSITNHGRQAEQYAKSIISQGEMVRLEYDVQLRDKYGRILAYVYLNDGTMLNEKMLLNGYAKVYTIPPDVKYVERFKKAQSKAQNSKAGLWGEK
jgi:micrococcal nuclease